MSGELRPSSTAGLAGSATDTTASLGTFWRTKLDAVCKGEFDPQGLDEPLREAFDVVLTEDAESQRVAPTLRFVGDGVKESISSQFSEVGTAFGRRREAGKPAEPNAKGFVKKAAHFDDTKILKTEAELAKRFNEKVSAPGRENIRESRVKEHAAAFVTELCRGNELFDKRDYEDSLAEYAAAAEVPTLRLFAMVNRGNAFKALGLSAEAIACYQDVLDEAPMNTVDGRLVHSYAYNNLGAACQDAGRLEQSLQHLSSAMALNRNCYLAIRNRANVHMHMAESLATAEQGSLLPPQHETAGSFYAKAMEQDWHLPTVFGAGGGDSVPVLVRVEARVTSDLEEPANKILRNSVYHFTTNLTHVTSRHV